MEPALFHPDLGHCKLPSTASPAPKLANTPFTMASTEQSSKLLEPLAEFDAATATPCYDLVCIGFGPAQVATAIANRESKVPAKVLFLERKPSFSWHSGSHVARTRINIPFVYDLATIRNPRSAFTYVNYLLAQKRLVEFANSDRLNPLRVEFEDYMKWCAQQFQDQVKYGTEAVEVIPESEDNIISGWKVAVRDAKGARSVVRARCVVAPSPAHNNSLKQNPLPSVDFLAGQRIIAMEDYQTRRDELRGANEPPLHVALVGSGLQTVEILDDLLSCPRLGNITVVTEDESLIPLQVLGEQEPPPPRLCSIWAKPSCGQKSSITDASELIQTIYMRAYEKQVASRGQFGMRVVVGKDAAEPCSASNFIIRDTAAAPVHSTQLLQGLDALVLGCGSKGDSLEEVHFKRNAVAGGCRVFLMSANSEGGRSLAKDIAVTAGKVVGALATGSGVRPEGRVAQARM
ncbi:L-lysine 6-monooxygenase (NADPH-requiring)-domain-containing protein [Ampelomyces quisqualis]|uniref:L-ornithine N(5)-monooxygenase [NAD(P)H] n=1 Tax=Ampelomyces quisqualis TaxID=50730 RepID=A0A6A5QB21_AMPQU|nr:L-lysine 6-monooxygenase (NADPH-requiring)-domain-containing protein [Ampelomyces quisqualis]